MPGVGAKFEGEFPARGLIQTLWTLGKTQTNTVEPLLGSLHRRKGKWQLKKRLAAK